MNIYDQLELLEKIRQLEDEIKELKAWQRNQEYMRMMEDNKKINKEK
jgi:TolA-binding protein